ncbi:MAG: hypothetical protein Q7S75_02735 [bacterium]|nr:hypothetical protein [bacterium]
MGLCQYSKDLPPTEGGTMKIWFLAACFWGLATLNVGQPANAQDKEGTAVSSPWIGVWKGGWDGISGNGGEMETEVAAIEGDAVSGRVRATNSPTCSVAWEKLQGNLKGDRIVGSYNLGGRCGKVEVIFNIDQTGKLLTGTWSSQYPGSGTLRLTKQ